MSDPNRARTLRRRHVHERQAVVFGVLLAGLAVVGLGATAIFTGSVDVPFLARGFAAEPTPTPTVAPYPCPPVGAKPVAYKKVTVNVYNGTTRSGLAAATLAEFAQRGFASGRTANAAPYTGAVIVQFGPAGIAAGYTVAAQVPGAQLRLDRRTNATVDVLLGDGWTDLVDEDDVTLDPAKPLPTPATCTPLDELAPGTAATAPATPAAPATKPASKK